MVDAPAGSVFFFMLILAPFPQTLPNSGSPIQKLCQRFVVRRSRGEAECSETRFRPVLRTFSCFHCFHFFWSQPAANKPRLLPIPRRRSTRRLTPPPVAPDGLPATSSDIVSLPMGFTRDTSDLDGMVKRRQIRALIILNPIGFFYDKGQPKGRDLRSTGGISEVRQPEAEDGQVAGTGHVHPHACRPGSESTC